nr:major facilitator superfamily domain, general substrate transporter [Tanacetum cinerariifolium]
MLKNHSKAGNFIGSEIEVGEFDWQTNNMETEAGIFVMRHMEICMGMGMDDVTLFETISGQHSTRIQMQTQAQREYVDNNILDTWSSVINHMEVYGSKESPFRMFLPTFVVKDVGYMYFVTLFSVAFNEPSASTSLPMKGNFLTSDIVTGLLSLPRLRRPTVVPGGQTQRGIGRRDLGIEPSDGVNKNKGETSKRVSVKRRRTSEKDNVKSIMLETRSSPRTFYNSISTLKPNQKACLEHIGFGNFVEFKVDRIPSKLGLYVVDKFDAKKMEMKLAEGALKITKNL